MPSARRVPSGERRIDQNVCGGTDSGFAAPFRDIHTSSRSLWPPGTMTNDPSRDTLNCAAPVLRLHDAVRYANRTACRLQLLQIERQHHQRSATRDHEMAGRDVPRRRSMGDDAPLMRRKRLEDDVTVVPGRRGAGSGRVDDRIAAWQEFRPVLRPFATVAVEGRQWLRLTAIGVHLQERGSRRWGERDGAVDIPGSAPRI